MLIRRPGDIPSSEITPEGVYVNRRKFIEAAGVIGAGAILAPAAGLADRRMAGSSWLSAHPPIRPPAQEDKPTPFEAVTSYNNFYEFGTDKTDPAHNAHTLKPKPWSVTVEGLCNKPGKYDLDDIIKWFPAEERVYRMRCVEGWSMVIPWMGFPLRDFVTRFEPTSAAKFVEFTTLLDWKQMPGQRSGVLDWPYVEGLRLDEAMHPLTLFATGLYGKPLPNQNGAPIRLVVPWKYGFKGIKSIVKVRFVQTQPMNTWQLTAPSEYGFYANVNPEVDHPRWTQKRERRVGEFIKRPTLPFNGYAQDVASLYAGMDLRKNF